MKISAGRPLSLNEINLMRKLGYKHWDNPQTRSTGYIRRLTAAFYPRFHMHVEYDENAIPTLDLHMDWRRPMHKKGQRSFEDGESDTVQEEAQRIVGILNGL